MGELSRRSRRMLRALLPADFAERYADDLFETHIDRARIRGTGSVRLFAAVAVDVVITTLQMRLQSRGRTPSGDSMRHTIRYALLSLSRAKAFSATVVVTLAIGIAATATLFTVTDRLLLSPAEHLVRPGELRRVFVHGMSPFTKERGFMAALSYPDYVDLEKTAGLTSLAAYAPMSMTVGEAGHSQEAKIERVSASYFPTLGVIPWRGRYFLPDDDAIGARLVAVLSNAYWRSSFGASDAAIGKTLRVGKGVYTIVGIAPPGFSGVDGDRVDVWLPMQATNGLEAGSQWVKARTWYWFAAIARIDAAAEARAAADATVRYRRGRLGVQGADSTAEVVLASIIRGRAPSPSDEARVAPALAGLALMVLLLACANVANLVLARGLQRRRTLAIQAAIGLSRRRLIAQAVAEVVVLAVAGGLLALGITTVATPLLFLTLLPSAAAPQVFSVRLAAMMLAVVGGTALIAGLVPAWRSTRIDPFEALRFTRETRRGTSVRQGLLFAQALLCALLLVGAGMFVRSLDRARHVDLGVDTAALTVQLELMNGSRFGDDVAAASYAPLDRIRALPGVTAAAVTSIPHFYGHWGVTLSTARDSIPSLGHGPFYYGAGGEYFEAIGLRMIRGRALTDDDDRAGAAPVAVISETLARRAFGAANAIGQCLYIEAKKKRCTQVVGVTEDALASVRADQPDQLLYLPPHHPDIDLAAGTLVVRARGDVPGIIEAIRSATQASRSDIRRVDVRPVASYLEAQFRSWRLGATLLTAFGGLAVLVAIAGIFSALSFEVAQRKFELAVRSALGASAPALIRTSTGRALVTCGGGALGGLSLAAVISSRLERLLFHVSPLEAGVYAPVLGLMIVAIAVATAIPAWRALRSDPKGALQAQ
jgi:putative ABC transport system permease protein